MTDKLWTLLGILMFAFVTAILYVWGLRKTVSQQERLATLLLVSCKNKVVKYLKSHEMISVKEIEKLINGIKVGEFWSRKRLTVQDPRKFSAKLIKFMTEQLYIEKTSDGNYRLKK